MLVTEYMEGGDLLHNIAAKRVSWYRRGKKVGGVSGGAACVGKKRSAASARHRRTAAGRLAGSKPLVLLLLPACMLQIALDVARGLVFLHSKRIAHFDLKSPNILLARWVGIPGRVPAGGRPLSAYCSPPWPALRGSPHW
jgi:serine/threonine protein kinase